MKALADQIRELDGIEVYGRVIGVRGLMVEVAGPIHTMSVGARVLIEPRRERGTGVLRQRERGTGVLPPRARFFDAGGRGGHPFGCRWGFPGHGRRARSRRRVAIRSAFLSAMAALAACMPGMPHTPPPACVAELA